MAKTYYIEKLGVRVDGFRTVTEARKAWEAKRDEWSERAAQGPHIFCFAGFTCIVAPTVHGWEYTITEPHPVDGPRHPTCYYGASNQIAAIADAVSALAQRAWDGNPSVDDGSFFDMVAAAARVRGDEVRSMRGDFVYLAGRWREHMANRAA